MKRITLATIKSFIRKTPDLYIKVTSSFDGMIDCIKSVDSHFEKAVKTDSWTNSCAENTLGIKDAWFVGQSRDRFKAYEDPNYFGYIVSNCCGSFILARKK